MAEMIPESISAAQDATFGEKKVFHLLREALQPDEEYIAWYEPTAIKGRPDFLVWSQTIGLLVVEVKDWVTSQIVSMNSEKWTIVRNGRQEVDESPPAQAQRYFKGYRGLLQQKPEFLHVDGPHAGKLKFPIGYCAILTNITRKQAEKIGILLVPGTASCLFSDDLQFDTDNRDARRDFVSKLKRTFVARFQFNPLTKQELTALRYCIFPEVRVPSSRRLRSEDQEELVKTLDLDQERTAKSIWGGHRVLKGVAGSGKTLVVTCRAKYLKMIHPEWHILIVCFNISLCNYLRHLLDTFGPDCNGSKIEIFHYHGLVKELTGANLGKQLRESREQWDARVGKILQTEIAKGTLKTRFDAVLIDEGQDFALQWIRSLTELLNEKTDNLLLCLDPAQNIFGRNIRFKSVGIKVQGKKPILLKKSYRNTVEILDLARTFSKISADSGPEEEEASLESWLFPMDMDRHGDFPTIIPGMRPEDQIKFILDEVDRFISQGKCSWGDIGVIYATQSYANFAKKFVQGFSGRFGADKVYWVCESRESKFGLDLSSQSVKLSTIDSAKGIEFPVVFLVGLEVLPGSDRDERSARNLAYVGITRAQDALYILGNVGAGFFGEIVQLANDKGKAAKVS